MKQDNFSAGTQEKYEDIHFVDSTKPVWNYSLFTEEDLQNFRNGTHYKMYEKFGSHQKNVLGTDGFYFAVWAPNATAVSVTGEFNNWDTTSHPLYVRLEKSGIWEGFIPHIAEYTSYKYYIEGFEGARLYKSDPFANHCETRPNTASKTISLQHEWNDDTWMRKRKKHNSLAAPWSVYEVHLGSWMRPYPYDEFHLNSYEQTTALLVPYVKKMGFTHIELMPVMEFPFDGSWGYQGTGYFAATSRFGVPAGLMKMIEAFHNEGIGVILDWVPSHFPHDAYGLYMFDGTHTYEYADMRKGYHPDWNSYIFNYKRGEVRSFLISSARFWFDKYHIDGIRVDAVSSMLHLDYSRKEGEWEPNEFGGHENLEAFAFIKDLNAMVYRDFPDVQMIAEESTNQPQVTGLTVNGGLGFGMKWMMGWMHDTIDFFNLDPLARKDAQDKFAFSMMYFYDENFMLPLSHDEVVHGKSPMIYKMTGDEWQKFATLRLLYTYMFMHPGGKLLFMGNEIAQTSEWDYTKEVAWYLLQYEPHKKMQDFIIDLNAFFRSQPALYEMQFSREGFEWTDLNHRQESVAVFMRKGKKKKENVLVVLNMTPVVRENWKIYVYGKKEWSIIFNSDEKKYWGSGEFETQTITTSIVDKKNKLYEINISLPALCGIALK